MNKSDNTNRNFNLRLSTFYYYQLDSTRDYV